MLTVGAKWPQFRVKACNGIAQDGITEITNETYADKWLVFVFYPKDFTFVCPTELVEFGRRLDEFEERGAVLLGASTDNEYSHLAWRQSHAGLRDLPYPLLAGQTGPGAGHPRPGGARVPAGHVHCRSAGNGTVAERQQPQRRPQCPGGTSRPGCCAVRRAMPVQLETGRSAPEEWRLSRSSQRSTRGQREVIQALQNESYLGTQRPDACPAFVPGGPDATRLLGLQILRTLMSNCWMR